MNPYVVLGIAPTADDAEIRKAYLDAIKANPPDTAPEKFQAIFSAYSKIQNEASRIEYILFNREPPGDSPLSTLITGVGVRGLRPLPFEQFQSFLRTCAKD